MSGFSAEWLGYREPVDHAARSDEILSAVSHYFANDETVCITDIGCGTGSTIRALKPFMLNRLEWHLVDHDDALLAEAKQSLRGDKMVFTLADLSTSLDCLFEQQPSMISTSAFLDLVSADWLKQFCTEVASKHVPFYAALTYDGRAGCKPEHSSDGKILSAFNTHQRTDKGFGNALGPNAAATAVKMFEDAGYIVTTAISDWSAGKRHPEFQEMLLTGWHEAASEIEPENRTLFDEWLEYRLSQIEQGSSSVYVGHLDFFAAPKP